MWLYQLWWQWGQDPNKMTARKIWDLPLIYWMSCVLCAAEAWMKEAMDNTSMVGVCLRCPLFISVHFSLRNEGSSEYIRLCEGRESLSPNFQTFHDPRHQFHGISTLASETLHPLATLTLLHMIPWTFLHYLNV